MYKLMIVEDEEIIRQGLLNGIPWTDLGFEVTAQASTGAEALDQLRLDPPDAILTDVRMPVMSGLELAEQVHQHYSEIKVLILSGYSDFKLLQSAMKNRVWDYLLKPTDIDIILETFQRLRETLDREAAENEAFKRKNFILMKNFERLRKDFLLHFIRRDDATQTNPLSLPLPLKGQITDDCAFEYTPFAEQSLLEHLQYYEVNLSGECFAVTVFKSDSAIDDFEQSLYTAFSPIGDVFVLQDKDANIVISSLHSAASDAENYLITAVQQVITQQNTLGHHVIAGIGSVVEKLTQLPEAYCQACIALKNSFHQGEKTVFRYDKGNALPSSQSIAHCPFKTLESMPDIVSSILMGDENKALSLLKEVFSLFRNNQVDPPFIQNYCYVILFCLSGQYSHSNGIAIDPTIWGQILNYHTISDLEEYMNRYVKQICGDLSRHQTSGKEYHYKTVEAMKTYLLEHYASSPSLEKLAEHVHLTPAYISFLFKSVTGMNYMDYLKNIRMEKALELLRDSDMKVYEIAYHVGYHDYKYFALQFKKSFHCSPTEYRQKSLAKKRRLT